MISHACQSKRAGCEEARLCHKAAKSSPYHWISFPYHSYHSISCAHLWVLVFVYHIGYHVISCDIMNHDITVCVLGAWAVVGGMISCDIMWYHVGWTAWSARFEFGVISCYIIIISCVGIMSLYHQGREMRLTWYDMEPPKRWDRVISFMCLRGTWYIMIS